ncbi:hypothetical protein ACFLU6_15765 [Acidobacteriota bacterium]
MSHSVLPKGEMLRKAVRWISEMRQDNPDKPMSELIDEAGRRFNLAPNDQNALITFLIEKPVGKKDE